MQHTYLSQEQLREFVRSSPWQFARTMPKTPHEYTLRTKAPSDEQFAQVVLYIRQAGYKGIYGKTTYTYLDIDGWQYWTMGNPLDITKLINRTKLRCQPPHCEHTDGWRDNKHYNCPAHGPHKEFYCPECRGGRR